MRSKGVHLTAACLLVGAVPVSALAQIFTSEFLSDPVSEGWILAYQYCNPETWNERGWYYQQLDACPPGPDGAADIYRRSLEEYDGVPRFFTEFRVQTDGDRSEIPGGAPALLVLGNDWNATYHMTVSGDLVQFYRGAQLPIWFIEVDSGVPHTYRVDLSLNWYAFYIDGYRIDEGVPEGPFPAYNPRISWRGRSWYLPCENAWDYIRLGRTPDDGSGDYDSDALVALADFYFVQECLTNERPGINGGPGNDAGPGCRFADFDGDADVDLLDFAEFQNSFGV